MDRLMLGILNDPKMPAFVSLDKTPLNWHFPRHPSNGVFAALFDEAWMTWKLRKQRFNETQQGNGRIHGRAYDFGKGYD